MRHVSRSLWRRELTRPAEGRARGAARPGAAPAGPARPEADVGEAEAFEREYPGARWLDARVVRQLELVGAKADALVTGVARRFGLSHAALNALAVIEGAGGPLSAGQVSAQMHISTATMTSVLDTLERNGHIRRQHDPADRRRVLIDITPAAQDLLDQVLPAVQQLVTATMSALPDQALHALLGALAQASDALDAAPHGLPPPPPRRPLPHLRRPRDPASGGRG